MFNSLLLEVGLSLNDVRLLRHADPSARKGRTPYELWRDDPAGFDLYQSVQSIARRPHFGDASHWASFGATSDGDTVFLGIYEVQFKGLLEKDTAKPHTQGFDKAGTCHRYQVAHTDYLIDCVGKLYIAWGPGARAWVQRPDRHNKAIVELPRVFKVPDFPEQGAKQ